MKIEELEKYRDEEGFIIMDEVLASKDFETLRETRGSQNREKFWITFDDAKIMLRTSNLDSENAKYTNYSELIVEELAKQVDIPCAHYDLIKYKGQKGVYTKSVLEKKNESLILAKTLLDQTETEDEYVSSVSIDDLFKSYSTFKKYDDVSKEQISKMCGDTAKVAIFEIFTMATDSHSENIGYVYYSDGKEKNIRLSPLFDNECSLMLDQPMESIDKMLNDKMTLKRYVELQNQLITIPESQRDDSYFDWEDTLFYLCDDYEICMEFAEKCLKNLNIEKAMENVEERIHAKLPDKLKEFASICFNTRKQMVEKDLCFEDIDKDVNEVDLW